MGKIIYSDNPKGNMYNQLFIYDLKEKKKYELNKDGGLLDREVRWSKDGKYILIGWSDVGLSSVSVFDLENWKTVEKKSSDKYYKLDNVWSKYNAIKNTHEYMSFYKHGPFLRKRNNDNSYDAQETIIGGGHIRPVAGVYIDVDKTFSRVIYESGTKNEPSVVAYPIKDFDHPDSQKNIEFKIDFGKNSKCYSFMKSQYNFFKNKKDRKDYDVVATIYPPKINPINNKVVGINKVKRYGDARIIKLEDDYSVFSITRNYYGPHLLPELSKYVAQVGFSELWPYDKEYTGNICTDIFTIEPLGKH